MKGDVWKRCDFLPSSPGTCTPALPPSGAVATARTPFPYADSASEYTASQSFKKGAKAWRCG
eukprot:3865611-Pyramimonas_sp.AAC.1